MNHVIKAAIALALGVGLAGAAQAHGNLQGARTTPQQQAAMQQQMQQSKLTKPRLTRQQAMRMRHARLAMARQHRSHRIATLHRKGANQTVGVGSSTPNGANTTSNGTTPITPPANPTAGAGSSNATTNQNTTNNK